MGRIRGSVRASTNYEPHIAGPFDSRSLVAYKNDLIQESTWVQNNGVAYIYNGMLVGVYNDSVENNGYYILLNKNEYQSFDSWCKIAHVEQLLEIKKQLDDLSVVAGGSEQFVTRGDLPNIGLSNKTYFVTSENATYRWDEKKLTYFCTGRDYNEIEEINGGNAANI